MKKCIAIILAFSMMISLAACGSSESTNASSASSESTAASTETSEKSAAAVQTPEATPEPTEAPAETGPDAADAETPELPDPKEEYYGQWYGTIHGLTVCLDLEADDAYTITYPALTREPATGKWILSDGFIYMDDEETPSISALGEVLSWTAPNVFLTREEPEEYAPADAMANAENEYYNGYWVSAYVKVDGAYVYASSLEDDTDIYIDGTHVALGGSFFGDVIEEFKFENGALVLTEGEGDAAMTITLQLLEDSMLSMELIGGGAELNIILTEEYVEGVTDEE